MAFGRVTRATVGLVAVLTLGACGRAAAIDAATEERIDAAQTVARRSLDEVERFEARVSLLERRVARQHRTSERLRAALAERTGKLGGSLDRLDRELAKLGSTSEAASEAVATAQEAARDLTVLERRYEYHLRRYHGGG
jgi:uncharacterized coiled-coil protein SlyX